MPSEAASDLPPAAASANSFVELRWVVGVCIVGLVWTISASYGLAEPPGAATYLFGYPKWFFWGVLVPWLCCYGLSLVFCFCVMRDEPLGDAGADRAEEGVADDAQKESHHA